MGRPRKHDYEPGVARYTASRTALKEAGGARISITLKPEANAALEAIVAETGETKADAINRLILQAGAKP